MSDALVSAANYLLLLAALRADVNLEDPPLVRTKDRNPGERRTLNVRVHFQPGSAAMLNCWEVVFASAGLKGLKAPPRGPLGNVKVFFRGREGFYQLIGRPMVQFRAPVDAVTDTAGVASATVEGRPQKRQLPDSAASVMRQATTSIQVRPVDIAFIKDLQKAASSAAASLSVIVELIKRINPVPFLYSFPVRDWQEGRRFTIESTWTKARTPTRGDNRDDTYGTATFTGEMGCLPPESPTDPLGWHCAGEVVGNGSGTYLQYRREFDDTVVCSSPWRLQGRRYQFTGYTLSPSMETISAIEIDRIVGPPEPACDQQDVFIEHVFTRPPLQTPEEYLPIPEPGRGIRAEWSVGDVADYTLNIVGLD